MKKILMLTLVPAVALAAASVLNSQPRRGPIVVLPPPNPAMSAPDQTAWNIFIQAVRPPLPAGPVKGKRTNFETWPSDHDTFKKGAKPITPVPPTAQGAAGDGDELDLRPPVLPTASMAKAGSGHVLAAAKAAPDLGAQTPASASQAPIFNPTPPGLGCNPGTPQQPIDPKFYEPACDLDSQGNPTVQEEVRRNPAAYNYIIGNQLNSKAGLARAFKANMTINFPVDAVEVKTNWLPVSRLATYYPGVPQNQFFIATDMVPTPAGSQPVAYALIAMHVISKQVPNWTWATFEHQGNRGRCDFLGCKDIFGAVDRDVPPANAPDGTNQGTVYPNCAKTPAVLAAFRAARVDPVFANYCLKGSQADFTDNQGMAVRVGNSVTENGFVPQASCMSCHGSANINAKGNSTTFFGFIGQGGQGNGQVGPINPLFYYNQSGGRPYYQDQAGLNRIAISADFVWSIPFCAYDEDGKSGCSTK